MHKIFTKVDIIYLTTIFYIKVDEIYSIIKKDFLISKYKNQIQIKDISSEIFNLNILININVLYLIYKNIL